MQPSPQELPPHAALLLPIWLCRDRPQVALFDRVRSPLDGRQKEDCFLDIGSQQGEVENLREACPRDVSQEGHGGVVGHDSALD